MVPLSHNLRSSRTPARGCVQIKHNVRGHGTYLLGEWHHAGHAGILPGRAHDEGAAAVVRACSRRAARAPARRLLHAGRPPSRCCCSLFSPTCRVQIGVRFMFPLIVLAYIARGGRRVARGRGHVEGRSSRGGSSRQSSPRPAATSLWAWPHGMSYFNQLWGGPGRRPATAPRLELRLGPGAAGTEGVVRGPRRRADDRRVVLRHGPGGGPRRRSTGRA